MLLPGSVAGGDRNGVFRAKGTCGGSIVCCGCGRVAAEVLGPCCHKNASHSNSGAVTLTLRHDLLELQTNPLPAWQPEVRASLHNASIADSASYPESVHFYDPPGRSTADSISISIGNGDFGQIARSCRRASRSKARSRPSSKVLSQSLSLSRCDAREGW